MTVLLATCAGLPEGEPNAAVLDREFARRGLDARWVRWDDPDVDWSSADLIAARSTWDYSVRHLEFLDWARAAATCTPMLNGPDVFAWNTDKAYLAELDGALPSVAINDAEDFAEALQRWHTVVVKPRVGAGGRGVEILDGLPPSLPPGLLAQPLVESIATDGEISVFVIDGTAVAQMHKIPATGEIRVHEQYGGVTREVALDPDLGRTAEEAFATARHRFPDSDVAYLRVDLLRWRGDWVISELEMIEPGLYLDASDTMVVPFVDCLERRLG